MVSIQRGATALSGSAARWLVAGCAAVCLAAAPASARADEKEDVALPTLQKSPLTPDEPRPQEKVGPKVTAERFVVKKEKEVEDARQRVMDRLEQILARTAKDSADYPEYLFRKALLLEERARFFFHRAMRKDDGPIATDPAEHAKIEKAKEEDLAASKAARMDTLKVWAQIYRDYPAYPNADQALFNLGQNLTRLGQAKKALKFITELIRRFPESKLLPDAFLAIGEYYFDVNDMATALKAYERVTSVKESPLYGFAIYKQAWCHYNLSDYKTAMKRFIEVIRYGERTNLDQNKLDLLTESKREIILAYSHAAAADRAKDFFPNVVAKDGDAYWTYVEPNLAELYFSQGKFAEALYLYKSLVAKNPGSALAVSYQVKVVRSQLSMSGRQGVSSEVFELIRQFKAIAAGTAPQRDEARKSVEQMVRELAITYHADAMKLRSKEVYALAADMYKAYVEAFGDDPEHGPDTKFFLGELYYTLERWEEAGNQYLEVAKGGSRTKYFEKAIYAAIVSYNKALRGDKISGGEDTLKREGSAVPASKPIPPMLLRLAEACELYLTAVPPERMTREADVRYRLARIYYEHFHFKEAAQRLEAFLDKFEKHRLAAFAGPTLLDALNAIGDFERLAVWGKKLLKGGVAQRKELRNEIEDVTQGATLKNIESLTAQNKHQEAAAAYDDFLKRYPKSQYLDKVLNNAATAFEKVAQPERAIELRDRLVREFSDSPLAPDAMYAIGLSYHHQGVYSLAATYYEALSQSFGAYPGADKALNAAALFREGGGEFQKAIENLNTYIKRYGKDRKGKDVADKYFRIGTLFQRMGDWTKVKAHFERFLAKFPATPDQRLQALWEIARATQALTGGRDEKRLARKYERVVDVYNELKPDERNALKKGRPAVAQARFQQAEALFRAFERLKIVSNNTKKLKQQLSAKGKGLLEAKNAFYDVIRFKQAEWAIAAYSRTGQIYQGFAKALIDSPPPKKLPAELQAVYKEQLETEAAKVEKTAREAFIECLKTSRELKVYTNWTRVAEKQLAVLLPKDYAESNELKVQPSFAVAPPPQVGDPKEAAQAHERVLQTDPTNSEAMNARGLLARQEGGEKWQEAVKWFRRALTANPKDTLAYRNLAWTYYTIGKYDLAHLVSLNAELMSGQPDPAVLNNWGLVQLRRGKLPEAVGLFKRAIELNPDFAQARFNFGALAVNYSDYATAEAQFKDALRIDAKSADGQIGLGLALRGGGKLAEAQKEYERALELDKAHPLAHFNLGILFQEFLDKPQEAMAAFQRYLEVAPADATKARQDVETRMKNLRQLLDVLNKGKSLLHSRDLVATGGGR